MLNRKLSMAWETWQNWYYEIIDQRQILKRVSQYMRMPTHKHAHIAHLNPNPAGAWPYVEAAALDGLPALDRLVRGGNLCPGYPSHIASPKL